MHILQHYCPPTKPYLDVLYRDAHLLILNKQSGLLTVPGKHEDHKDCLESRAQEAYPTARIIHRLDMETSGVIALALDRETHRQISKQFERRKTQKTYIARLFGGLPQDEGSIDLPLICDWPNRPKQMVDHTNGKAALTHYRVLKREAQTADHPATTRVEFTPTTGRSHQLRVHALSIGHPILGDMLYGDTASRAAADRLQLHARTLTLFHPALEKTVTFEADLPF
jgi:tRNA pseudouridine32 synthase / 23S rRNA pseudouridine746 synthase